VLTSSQAFSGGKDLGYTLQAPARAKVIGEAAAQALAAWPDTRRAGLRA